MERKMDERMKRSQASAARISRRGFFSSAGAASAGLFAASVLSISASAGDDTSGGISLPPICELPNPIPHSAPTPFCVLDAFTFANSLTPTRPMGNPVAAQVGALDINWAEIFRRVTFNSSVEKFAPIRLRSGAYDSKFLFPIRPRTQRRVFLEHRA